MGIFQCYVSLQECITNFPRNPVKNWIREKSQGLIRGVLKNHLQNEWSDESADPWGLWKPQGFWQSPSNKVTGNPTHFQLHHLLLTIWWDVFLIWRYSMWKKYRSVSSLIYTLMCANLPWLEAVANIWARWWRSSNGNTNQKSPNKIWSVNMCINRVYYNVLGGFKPFEKY